MKKHPSAQVILSQETQRILVQDVCQRPKIEACGLLLGHISEQGSWHIQQARPLRNIFDSPVYFEFAPEDLLEMELTYPEQIVGVYHSHPTGFATASSTDRQNMQRVNQAQQIPWIWLIICGPFDDRFMERNRLSLANGPIIAYHHYTQEGLRQITVLTEQEQTGPEEI